MRWCLQRRQIATSAILESTSWPSVRLKPRSRAYRLPGRMLASAVVAARARRYLPRTGEGHAFTERRAAWRVCSRLEQKGNIIINLQQSDLKFIISTKNLLQMGPDSAYFLRIAKRCSKKEQ